MPPKVSKVSSKPTQTKTIAKASTSSSSKSSGSSKTSSSSSVRKTTTTSNSRPTPSPRPKDVDKVDFGKPKPTASAGTYKPAQPPKPSAAELARIAREEERATARTQLPGLIKKANEAYEKYEEARQDVRSAHYNMLTEQAKWQHEHGAGQDMRKIIQAGVAGAMTGGALGKRIADECPPQGKLAAELLAPTSMAIEGAIVGSTAEAINVWTDGKPGVEAAEELWEQAKKEETRLGGLFRRADETLYDCVRRAVTITPIEQLFLIYCFLLYYFF